MRLDTSFQADQYYQEYINLDRRESKATFTSSPKAQIPPVSELVLPALP